MRILAALEHRSSPSRDGSIAIALNSAGRRCPAHLQRVYWLAMWCASFAPALFSIGFVIVRMVCRAPTIATIRVRPPLDDGSPPRRFGETPRRRAPCHLPGRGDRHRRARPRMNVGPGWRFQRRALLAARAKTTCFTLPEFDIPPAPCREAGLQGWFRARSRPAQRLVVGGRQGARALDGEVGIQ